MNDEIEKKASEYAERVRRHSMATHSYISVDNIKEAYISGTLYNKVTRKLQVPLLFWQ